MDAPVDIASLVAFRIGFGLLMSAAMVRSLARGFVRTLYVEPSFHFTWAAFSWVRPWPAWGMYAHFVLLALLALGVALGWRYRLCAAAFCVGFTYVELLDKAAYLNHYYLVSLLAALLAVLPAHRAGSLDARRRPSLRVDRVSAGCLYVLRAQVAVVYLFAGIAKLNGDWLLRAQPLRIWLAARADLPVIGPLLAWPATAAVASWAGALLDLLVVPLLLVRRTRPWAYAGLVLFHLLTAALFPGIGLFPWLMILAGSLFFPPSWPRRLWPRPAPAAAPRSPAPLPLPRLLALHCAVQVAIPLWQHFAHPDSAWTGRGFNFAWKVMVAEKTGDVSFTVRDPASGATRRIAPAAQLTAVQAAAMAQDPAMIRAFARHLAGGARLQVHAEAFASLNGRPAARLLDPTVDLAADPLPAGWILPRPPP